MWEDGTRGYSYIMTEKTSSNLWSKEFIFLLTINIINSIAFGTINPIFPGFIVSLGGTLTVAGLITGLFAYAALAGRPLASILGDRGNKKKLLILFMLGHGLFSVLYAFAPSVIWVIVFRIFRGLSFSVSGTISISLGADFIPKERMGEGIGFLGVGQILGMALGPNIAVALLDVFGYSYPPVFLISGITIMVAGLLVIFLKCIPREPATDQKRKKFTLQEMIAVELLPLTIFTAIFAVGTGLVGSFIVLMSVERGIPHFGLFFIVNAIVILLARPFAGRITDQKGTSFVVLPSFIFMVLALLLVGFSSATWHLLLAGICMAFGSGIAFPGLQTECIGRLGVTRRTVAVSTYLVGMDIGMGAAPILGGAISDATSFTVAFVCAAVVAAVGFVSYLLYIRGHSKNKKHA